MRMLGLGLAAALAAGAAAATWRAAPAADAQEANRAAHIACQSWIMQRPATEATGRLPSVCMMRERETWETSWLTIAAVLAVGAALVAVLPATRRT
jgi:hypothetical protein